jgi:hypothetical protein
MGGLTGEQNDRGRPCHVGFSSLLRCANADDILLLMNKPSSIGKSPGSSARTQCSEKTRPACPIPRPACGNPRLRRPSRSPKRERERIATEIDLKSQSKSQSTHPLAAKSHDLSGQQHDLAGACTYHLGRLPRPHHSSIIISSYPTHLGRLPRPHHSSFTINSYPTHLGRHPRPHHSSIIHQLLSNSPLSNCRLGDGNVPSKGPEGSAPPDTRDRSRACFAVGRWQGPSSANMATRPSLLPVTAFTLCNPPIGGPGRPARAPTAALGDQDHPSIRLSLGLWRCKDPSIPSTALFPAPITHKGSGNGADNGCVFRRSRPPGAQAHRRA